MTEPPKLTAWIDGVLESFFRAQPVDATFIGRHEYDHLLPDVSPEAESALRKDGERRLAELHALAHVAGEIDERLHWHEAADRDLARGYLEIRDWEIRSGLLSGNPSWYAAEAIFGWFSLLLRDYAPLGERLDALEQRLAATPSFLAQARGRVEDAPPSWTERAIRECGAAAVFLRDGLPLAASGPKVAGLAPAAADALRAFESYREHLEGLSSSRPARSPGCGAEAFDSLVQRAHELEWSASELARLAERELERCDEELSRASPDWRGALAELEANHPSPEQYLESFGRCWEDARRHAEAHGLVSWPDAPIRYAPRPPWCRAAAPDLYFLFYRSPAPLDPPARHDYLVAPLETDDGEAATRLLRATNDSVIKLNHVVHHGGLGHHVQNWHARRSPSRFGQIAAVDGASRIAMLCGGTMAEGWACYATDVMDETGFLTPLESLSQHHAHARMAARTLVDVRLHRREWTFEQAERFYVETAQMSPAAARAETTKNSMFPGAAVIYFAGTTLIYSLRRELRRAEGASFDLQRFHDRFLSYGSIPVSRIRRLMLEGVG